MKIIVVGAGAFGGWTALELRRRGAQVTVLDAWGPSHARASSGGETRVIRATYGSRTHYTSLTRRALQQWREFEAHVAQKLFHHTGVLWLFDNSPEAQAFATASAAALAAFGATMEHLPLRDAAARFPQIDFNGVDTIMFEPDAGYLMARRACKHVIERIELEGGDYRLAAVASPVDVQQIASNRLMLTDGTPLQADLFVFACGPWLGSLFPHTIGRRVIATRQEVYYFGTPGGDSRFTDHEMPVWIDFAGRQIYGIAANASHGFKVADDATGPEIDPTLCDRDPSATGVAAARAYLGRRFPALASAPLVGSEVCQYEASPDSDLIIDRHPELPSVWLVGGGSGHGFKLGPAIGELVASSVMDDKPVDPRFALTRFAVRPDQRWQAKWT